MNANGYVVENKMTKGFPGPWFSTDLDKDDEYGYG